MQVPPADPGQLGQVGSPGQPLPQQFAHAGGILHQGFHVQTCAEIHAGPEENHGAQVAVCSQCFLRLGNGLEHLQVQCIVLRGPVQAYICQSVFNVQFYAIAHLKLYPVFRPKESA